MPTTPETTIGWLEVFNQYGFMFLLAVMGFLMPPAMIWLAWFGIKKLSNPLRRLADVMDDPECVQCRANRLKKDGVSTHADS